MIIFCANPLNIKEPDIDYIYEYNIVKDIGHKIGLINLEALIEGKLNKAIMKIEKQDNKIIAIYRGWMLKPNQYKDLYNALLYKNVELINTPDEYITCHYLPNCYEYIKEYTPKTVWISKDKITNKDNLNYLDYIANIFKDKPVIIKDYVKSCKHDWLDACFIPISSDLTNLSRVINNFIKLRGNDFEGGLIIREFIELEFLINHSISNMPLSIEYRLFFINNELVNIYNYWDEGIYNESTDFLNEIKVLLQNANKIPSKFFTMDIAKTKSGNWIIIELGDGQVSGLPDNADLKNFYSNLLNINIK